MATPTELPKELATPSQPVDVLVIAGEHSGDQHAAHMIEAARKQNPSLTVAALGGTELENAGAQLLLDMTSFSVVGLAEVLRNYGFFKKLMQLIVQWIEKHQPKAVCFVDYPGFNLRVAKELAAGGISQKAGGKVKLLYYISPQVWAWKGKRRFAMADLLDELAIIFPFETNSYTDTSLPVRFVGHPFITAKEPLPVCYAEDAPILLLPGSRTAAVSRIFPLMLEALDALVRIDQTKRAKVLYPSATIRAELEKVLVRYPNLEPKIELADVHREAPHAGAAVLTSSGTMSLACALACIPGAIVYRAHPATYVLGRMLVKIPYLGIANLLLKKDVYPEYIQGKANRYELLRELRHCLNNPKRIAQATADAKKLRELLGEGEATPPPEQWLLSHLS